MAKNRRHEEGRYLELSVPAETESGDPVVVGALPAVALTDRQDNGKATCQTDGVFELEVTGKNKAGEKAIAEGDVVYLTAGVLNVNDEEGVPFGYALAPVVKNKTEVIPVKVGL
jgi:predicted RecA/RadA family phage recombinase